MKRLWTLLALVVLLAGVVPAALAQGPTPEKPPQAPSTDLALGANPNPGIESLGGSFVVLDPSVGGDTCYIPSTTQTFCFRAESFSPDWEYVYNIWQRFPADWTVTNVYVQGTPYCDQGGTWGTFSWSFQTSPYEVNIYHPRYQANNPAEHCVAYYCFDVTSGTGAPDALESWYWDGDGYGSSPHNPCSNDGYTPSGQPACDEAVQPPAAIPPCALDPIMLTPPQIDAVGCPYEPQQHQFTVWNNAGYDTNVDLTYTIVSGSGTCSGPAQVFVPNGGNLPITVDLTPQGNAGDTVVCEIYAVDATTPNNNDTSYIVKDLVDEIIYWEQIATMPGGRMDNVVGAYNGYVWDVTGYGASTSVYRYDPTSDTWTTLTPGGTVPPINYARSGCTHGNMIYTYGDATTTGFTGLWGYNMDTNTWAQLTPGGTPPAQTGIWAPAWAHDPDTGLCYMTGGATAAGGGNLTTVYVYDPVANAWLSPLPNFTTARDFHAAFVMNGMLCVMGGVDASSVVYNSTQCYNGTSWNAENADIPALPMGWWGMGYADKWHAGTDHQLWLMNGADAAFALINDTYYYDVNAGQWVEGGPLPSGVTYRTSATTLNNELYKIGGSTGGFSYSGLSDHHVQIICAPPGGFDAWKEAPVEVMSGETMRYTITVQAPAIVPGLYMSDTLPAGVEYAGNLAYTAGYAWYDDVDNAVYWTVPPLRTAAPAPARPTFYYPSEVADRVGSPAPDAPAPEGSVTTWARPEAVLWDNGPLVTHPGGGYNGADASALQSALSMNTYGFGNQFSLGYRMADDFTITDPAGWQIDTITFFAYQTGAPTDPSTITGLYFQIWDGPPWAGGSVIWGDLTTNRLVSSAWSGIYRSIDTNLLANNRPIMADVGAVGITLPPGTYWLDWMTDGSLSSGPWAPPITILGQTTTGDAYQYTTAWAPALDSGTSTQQGMPFIVEGTIPSGEQAMISFDVTVTAYCGEVIHNEGIAGDGTDVVVFAADTAVLGEPEIEVTPVELWSELCPDGTEAQTLQICNVGTCDLVWTLHEMTPTLTLAGSMPFVPVSVDGQGINPGLTTASPRVAPVAVPAANPEAVLWDQPLSSVDQNAYVDQEFSDYPDYSSFLADDFSNADPWVIESIFVPGNGWNGFTSLLTFDALTWQIYADCAGVPCGDPHGGGNPPVWTLSLAPNDPQVVITNGSGGMPSNTQLNLATPITLPSGNWWLVFYPTGAFGTVGQYGRQPADTTNGYTGQFINPGGGFGYGTTWQPWTIIGATQQDIAFRIEGQIAVAYPDFPWIGEDPTAGVVAPGTCQTVTVTFDATGLTPGDYFADIVIESNDADEPETVVPTTLTVLEPAAIVDVAYGIDGLTVAFTSTVSGSEPIDYLWDFGDGGSSTDPNPIHTYAEGGCYTVTLDVANACGQDSWSGQVCVEQPCDPVHDADFSWSPLAPLVNETVYFTGTAAGTGPITYAWDFGDGGTGSGENPTHAYAAAGTYTVLMTATNGCGEDYATYDIVVVEGCVPPTGADFTWLPPNPAAGQVVAFTGSTVGGTPLITFTWSFGDGGTDVGNPINHTYALSGTYTVVMTATNACGAASATHDVVVSAVGPNYYVYLPIIFKTGAK